MDDSLFYGVFPTTWRCTVAVLLFGLGSNVPALAIKAALVNLRSLRAGFEIGVATRMIVPLSPTARLATAQAPPNVGPLLQLAATQFSGSGRESPTSAQEMTPKNKDV